MTSITRSPGIPTGHMGLVAGGGYSGATEEFDSIVQAAAEALHAAYGRDVTIRFNSDRKSGGAWIITHPVDGFGRNAEIGITVDLYADRREVDALYDRVHSGEITYRELDRLYAALPRSVRISCHVGKASRRYASMEDAEAYPPAPAIEAAIEWLRHNAVLHDSYD